RSACLARCAAAFACATQGEHQSWHGADQASWASEEYLSTVPECPLVIRRVNSTRPVASTGGTASIGRRQLTRGVTWRDIALPAGSYAQRRREQALSLRWARSSYASPPRY